MGMSSNCKSLMLFPKQLRMQCQLGTLVLAPLLGSRLLVTITGSSLPLGLCSNNAITVKVPGAIVVERVRVSLHKDGGITILIVVLPNQSKELTVDLPEVAVIGDRDRECEMLTMRWRLSKPSHVNLVVILHTGDLVLEVGLLPLLSGQASLQLYSSKVDS